MQTGKRFNISFNIFSVGYIILGFLMIFFPDTSQRLICYLLGALALLLGIVCIVSYFVYREDTGHIFRYELAIGAVLLIIGIYIIAKPDVVWRWLPVILGLCIVFDSIIKLQHSFDLRRIGFGGWWVVLIAAIATTVLGVLLIVNAFDGHILMYYFGAVLISDGIVNLVTVILIRLRVRKLEKMQEAPQDTTPAPPQE